MKKRQCVCAFFLSFWFAEHQAFFQHLLLEGHTIAVVRACAQTPASLLRVSHCVYNSRRSEEKDIFTESRNVGQVGARGDPEQGQRWHQAGHGRNWKSTKMVRASVNPFTEQKSQACVCVRGGGETTRNNETKPTGFLIEFSLISTRSAQVSRALFNTPLFRIALVASAEPPFFLL